MADTSEGQSGNDAARDSNVPDSLDKYTPNAEDVLGDEDERERSGTPVRDATTNRPPAKRLDYSKHSSPNPKEDKKKDSNHREMEVASHARTGFDPSDWGDRGKGMWMWQMYATGQNEENRGAIYDDRQRQKDIDLLARTFDLSPHERWIIEQINEDTNLNNHGSPRFENLLLAALRAIFRGRRNCTLRSETPDPHHSEYVDEYEQLREAWNAEKNAVTRLTNHATTEFAHFFK